MAGRAQAAARPAAAAPKKAEGEVILPEPPAKKRGKLKLILMIAVPILVLAVGGGGAYFFLFSGGDDTAETAKEAEPPVPAFVEVKTFIVTIKDKDGAQHYLQLGMNLKVTKPEAVAAVTTVLPEVLDQMRQTILGYKADELETPEGVNKMRTALVEDVNGAVLKSLGPAKIKKLGDDSGKALVQNIFFSSLIVE